ncbi:MAG: hypothetical protein ACREHV_07460, partial [Rhizomicrobium sp.]
MLKHVAVAALALALSGCGGYFDQHPANVRPENEAAAAVLGYPPSVDVAESRSSAVAPVLPASRPAAVVAPVSAKSEAPPAQAPAEEHTRQAAGIASIPQTSIPVVRAPVQTNILPPAPVGSAVEPPPVISRLTAPMRATPGAAAGVPAPPMPAAVVEQRLPAARAAPPSTAAFTDTAPATTTAAEAPPPPAAAISSAAAASG